ncbi:MAG: DsbA family protein [Gaiellaceae bacterium]
MATKPTRTARTPAPPTSKDGRKRRASARGQRGTPPRGPGAGIDRRLLFGGGLLALVVVVVLVAVSVGGGDDGGSAGGAIRGADESAALLEGIPQDGAFLGSPDAPVTLVEYGDLQCPFCAEWSAKSLPAVVDEYVRPGDVRLEFRGLTFLDAGLGTTDSDEALRAVLSAGEQNKLWNVLELLYRNQGAEGSGWVTEDVVRRVGESVEGLDVEQFLAARADDSVTTTIQEMAARADVSGVGGTPSFEAGSTGRQLSRVEITSLEPDGIRPTLDALLAG